MMTDILVRKFKVSLIPIVRTLTLEPRLIDEPLPLMNHDS